MTKEYKRFYFIILTTLVLISVYPLFNGIRMGILYLNNGVIEQNEYAKYVIPYAAICFSIIIVAAFQPIIFKVIHKFQLLFSTILAMGIFFPVELWFESMRINTDGLTPINGFQPAQTIDVWQSYLCYVSPDTIEAARKANEPFAGANGFYYVGGNGAYKVHYYIISLIIITLVTGVIAGLGQMIRKRDITNKTRILLQAVSAVALIILCIFANTTGFFRDTSPIQSPTASLLTMLFFIILGIASGIYLGSFLLKRSNVMSLLIPTVAASAITIVMYVGEGFMMDNGLYRFGVGWFFSSISGIVVAPIDIAVILLSGLITLSIFLLLEPRKRIKGIYFTLVSIAMGVIICLAVIFSQPITIDNITTNDKNTLEFFLVAGALPEGKNIDINDLILEDTPVFTSDDIQKYYWDEQTFVMKKDLLAERLGKESAFHNLPVPVSGRAFVTIVNNERIYIGYFWTMLSSVWPASPCIYVEGSIGVDDGRYNLQPDQQLYNLSWDDFYGDNTDFNGEQIQEQIYDSLIHDALEKMGLLAEKE